MSREASIKVSIRRSSFNSDLRGMESQAGATGRKIGNAFRAPMSAGLTSIKQSIAGIGSQIKNTIKRAAQLGGALATGALIKDALEMQGVYRNISFSLSKIPGQIKDWQDVQSMVDTAVENTKQSADKLAESFHEVFKATGDAEFSATAMERVGYAATATGEKVESLAQASQLLKRKFGVTEDSLTDALTRFIQLTGSGGKSLDELTGRFAVMAGEARQAGMQGADGVSELLGMLLLLDERIGEKADPGLKMLFQTLKSGTSQLKRIQKEGRIKIEPEAGALEKLKQILSSTKARAAAEMTITADARTVFDELAKPFDLAMKEAKEKGLKKAEALDAALKAFDDNIAKASKTTMTWDDIMKKHSERVQSDPTVQLNDAINKVKKAFTQPKMIDAIGKLAEKLPDLAEALADLVDWAVDNPWKAVAAGAGLKVGASFVGGVAGNALPSMLSSLFGFGKGGIGAGAGGAEALAAAQATSGQVGLVWQGLAKGGKGAVSALAKLGKPFAGSGGIAGQALLAAAGLTAAGAAGYKLGDILYESVLDPMMKKDFEDYEKADDLAASAKRKLSKETTVEEKLAIFKQLQEEGKGLVNGPSAFTQVTGGIASLFTDAPSPTDMSKEKIKKVTNLEYDYSKAIRNQMADELSRAGKLSSQWEQVLFDPLKDLNTIMKDFKTTMQDVKRESSGVGNATRGPGRPSNRDNKPGADKRR